MSKKSKEIHIINCGFGNLSSVKNAIDFLEFKPKICEDPKEIKKADHIILPGVGSFESGMNSLKKNGWSDTLQDYVKKGKFLFGICLGMQLLFTTGKNENNDLEMDGLGFFSGTCEKFFNRSKIKLQLPHIGFNKVKVLNSKIWKNLNEESYFYFVHSYRVNEINDNYKFGETFYGEKFISYIESENIFGSQFHPEKSHKKGLTLIKNFCEL
tara:strand:+ start:1120 stop:1755 length:636 start_codon:yes stop_codon:yes gene_type:complete